MANHKCGENTALEAKKCMTHKSKCSTDILSFPFPLFAFSGPCLYWWACDVQYLKYKIDELNLKSLKKTDILIFLF